ncbi:MAG: ABC transporter ATP-binding protein [Candidatus Nanohaloarchaeota archaeon QJJ-7]|nr:ABC transporter ATP-binding protein [Candidatus Nanohaloarchaeota archaeon QJJ-7]
MVLAVDTEELRKDYGEVKALEGVDIEVEEGEFFGLLGPNGAGKTTFINILVGLAEKSAGEARVFGHDVEEDYQEVRDLVGLSPQEFNVDRFFPIKEVLVHKAGYHGIGLEEARKRAEDVLRTVGLEKKKDTRFDWLSGGMKRRFLLARALVTDPDLLILDEPTAGVDVQLRHELWDLIQDMNESGTTVLLTTHYIEEAERLCDRVTILNHGEVITDASPEKLMGTGADTISLQLERNPEKPPDIETETVEETWMEDGRLNVKVGNGGRDAPRVLEELQGKGHDILDMDIQRSSLEEIFIELTGDEG